MKRLLLVALAVAFLAGCGDDEEATPAEKSQARVYFLLDDQVWPVAREIPEDGDAASRILDALAEGPTEDEEQIGLESSFPDGLEVFEVTGGVATVTGGDALTGEQRAQLVYSLTQLDPVVTSVEIDGTSYERADFEDQTPSVLVESPRPFDEVETPLRVTGTANTFEANFQYELLDSDGNVVDENFVTATSGTGTRGTFDFTTDAVDDLATLVVFESSAEDGSRIHEVEIPLTAAT